MAKRQGIALLLVILLPACSFSLQRGLTLDIGEDKEIRVKTKSDEIIVFYEINF